jgi:hypothetical protein
MNNGRKKSDWDGTDESEISVKKHQNEDRKPYITY